MNCADGRNCGVFRRVKKKPRIRLSRWLDACQACRRDAAKASGPAVRIMYSCRAFRTDPPFIVAPFSRRVLAVSKAPRRCDPTFSNRDSGERIRKCIVTLN
ncbi:hypothetical protein ANTRET_LOCUS8005 [Anthophora retusa]